MKVTEVKITSQVKERRIGIYSGTFDPVHAGHVAFALQALEKADLEAIYFLPERLPRYKPHVEHFGHRTAMLERALRPHVGLKLIDDLPEPYFSVARTLPRLRQKFPEAKLCFLIGSDVATHISSWDSVEELLRSSELIVGLREGSDGVALTANLPEGAKAKVVSVARPGIRSSLIRKSVYDNASPPGLLKSVYNYVRREWLYLKNPS